MPRNPLSPTRLTRVKVTCVDQDQPIFECQSCGKRWSPNYKLGGGFHRGFWKCPKGCNAHFQNIDRPRADT